MRIKHYLYNAFIIEDENVKIAIDPGKHLGLFKLNSLIPKEEWEDVTHLFVTHGDPDHFAYAIPMAKKSGAKIICGEGLENDFLNENIHNVNKLKTKQTIDLGDIKVNGLKTVHGPLPVKLGFGLIQMINSMHDVDMCHEEVYLGPIKLIDRTIQMKARTHGTIKLLFGLIRLEKDNVPFAKGNIGFKITIGNKTIINLGDALYNDTWQNLTPDVLMIPIGGVVGNTMDVDDALKAVKLIQPKFVLPMHYNCAFLWQKNINPTDGQYFKTQVEKMGIGCQIMSYGDEIGI